MKFKRSMLDNLDLCKILDLIAIILAVISVLLRLL